MPSFQPFSGMFLQIGGSYYEFMPHPLFPDDKLTVFALEGGTAFVYQLRNPDTGNLYALKVFKSGYRTEHIAQITQALVRYRDLTPLQPEQRICLTRMNYPQTVSSHPELEYAILMRWLEEPTWTGLLLNPATSARYTRQQALTLAQTTANVLWDLEAHGVAHGDLAGNNLVPLLGYKRIALLDLEDMYIPGTPTPRKFSQGTPGYQHRHLGPRGQWCPEGDRFAGAVLLTEILTWWEPRVRALLPDHAETLFSPEEVQVPGTPFWRVVRETLYRLNPNFLALFDRAWSSNTLTDCPGLDVWATTLLSHFS